MRTSSMNHNLLTVLFLPLPPLNGNPLDWYWRKIAGVPFLLRNVINLQRGGVKNLVLFTGEHPKIAGELWQRVTQDPRVTLELDWLPNTQSLLKTATNVEQLLFLDGSTLYGKAKISTVITPENSGNTDDYHSFFLSRASLHSLLKQAASFNYDEWELAREESITSSFQGPGSKKQLLVYLPETSDRKILEEKDFQSEEERIIKTSGGLKNDSFFTRILSRPISQRLTRLFLKTRFTPNQITILSFVLGLASAWCFFQGGYQMGLSGAGLLLLSIWTDGVDGEVARIKFMETTMGGKLDIFCDNVVHMAVFFAIGRGLFHATGQVIFLYLGLLAALGSLISFLMLRATIIEDKSKANSTGEDKRKKADFVDKLANRDFTHFLFLLALINQLDIFIWMTAVGVNMLAMYLLFSKVQS